MFSHNLQKLRSEKNISQEQLADKIGVSRQSISAWESGKSSPELDKLIALSELFEISLDELTGEISTTKIKFNKKDHEKSYKKVAIIRSLGMFILFTGIGISAFLSKYDSSLIPSPDVKAGIALMLTFAISIPLLILAKNFCDATDEELIDSDVKIEEVFSKKEIQNTKSIKNFGSMTLVSMIFIAVASHQIINNFIKNNESLASLVFMILLGIGISVSTYSNTIFQKINIFSEIANKNNEEDSKIGFFAAIIMLSTTAIYLAYSFLTNNWDSAKLFYPIGGIAIAIYAIYVKKK